MSTLDLFSIGSWALYDHIFRLSQYPKNGDTVTMDMPIAALQNVYYGECSANIAAVASKLGVRSGLGMVVGGDFIESGYQCHLTGLGVDLRGVEIRSKETSGHNYIYFDRDGDGFCISHQGVASTQTDWKVPVEMIQQSRYIVLNESFSSYTLQAAKAGKEVGAQVVLNGMVATSGVLAKEFVSLANILFISHSELSDLLSLFQLSQPDQLIDMGLELVFATQGKQGSKVYSHSGVETVPVIQVENFVDPTGAGDSYAAGTLAGLIKGMKPVQAAQIGATVSSFIIQAWGCQTNLPDWDEVLERHKQNF